METTTFRLENSVNPSHVRLALLLIPLACFALSPTAQATCQEGCLTATESTVLGDDALLNNDGGGNTAIGFRALYSNGGIYNTAIGGAALFGNGTGYGNTAVGYAALYNNRRGADNIALGYWAGADLTSGVNNIAIGNRGVAGESNHIRIGTVGVQRHTFIAGVSGATVADGVGVVVGADGHLGTVVSSERYKDAVKPMDKASEAILALKPVTFRYKKELDPTGVPQFGLVAEDVKKINPALVAEDKDGKPYGVRYEAVNAMLPNGFLKEHRTVQKQTATIARQERQIEALTAGLQKVNAQIELNKSAPKTVLNNQ
jgi:Chaperone of endosialidase